MAGTFKADAFADLVLREIEGANEIKAVEDLQKEVWGLPDLDVVPTTQLVAAKAAGGVLIGAFDGENLIGFVYGFVGYEEGRMTHHSHMLAVKPPYRDLSLGYRLKCAQRDFVLAQGITEMTWTFDPLQSLNAYFNFSRLGVVSDRYLVDFYGTDAASFLHQNGTDRLWVTWLLASQPVTQRPESSATNAIKSLVESGNNNAPRLRDLDLEHSGDDVSIDIPADIRSIESQDPKTAAAWRSTTRAAFNQAFSVGYVAIAFVRRDRTGKYILRRAQGTGNFLSE
jgi:chorismate synthase